MLYAKHCKATKCMLHPHKPDLSDFPMNRPGGATGWNEDHSGHIYIPDEKLNYTSDSTDSANSFVYTNTREQHQGKNWIYNSLRVSSPLCMKDVFLVQPSCVVQLATSWPALPTSPRQQSCQLPVKMCREQNYWVQWTVQWGTKIDERIKYSRETLVIFMVSALNTFCQIR